MPNQISHTKSNQPKREEAAHKSKTSRFFAHFHSALRRLKSIGFRLLFTPKVMRHPLGRRSSALNDIRKSRNFRRLAYTSATLLSLLVLGIFVPLYLVPEDIGAAPGTASDSTLTFISTRAAASVNLAVTSTDGTFATSANNEQAAFTISTNNYTGYTLTVKSSATGDNATKLSDGNNHTISSITNTSGISADTFSATGSDGAAYNNMWGYLPNYYASAENTNYRPAPEITHSSDTNKSDTLRATGSANSSNGTDNPDSYTIGLGLRADYSVPSGTYTNTTFILEYVANPVNYVITYDKNTTDTVTNMPYENLASPNQYKQSGNTSATSITLSSAVPVRDGYNFKGWCSSSVNDGDSCSGATYNPDGGGTNLSFGIDKTVVNTATLYAMWAKNLGTMQSFSYSTCQSQTTNNVFALTDSRDNAVYYAAKLADGNCWMLDNLRLGATTLQQSISSSNTNITSGVSFSLPSSSSSGFTSYTVAMINTDYANETTTSYGLGSGKIGAYYNYCAASAGGICSSTNSSNGSADRDICPKGWRIPTGGSSGDYQTLCTTTWDSSCSNYMAMPANNSKSIQSVLSMPLSGYYYGDQADYIEDRGVFWSSTYYNGNEMYGLDARESIILPQSLTGRHIGFSVRCLVKPTSTIVFNYGSNISNIVVKHSSGNTVTTITSSGGTADLNQGQTYTISPTFASGYELNSMTLSGSGTLSGTSFTVGTSSATITTSAKSSAPGKCTSTATCMQTATACDTTLTDARDGATYTVKTISGKCWMTQNLRFTWTSNDTLTKDLTHVSGNTKITVGALTSGDSYEEARIQYNNNTSYGAYYNYCATSAGTACSSQTRADAFYDICPKNWRLPTNSEFSEITSQTSAFSPVYSGVYGDRSLRNTGSSGYGYWWSATAYHASSQYILYYDSGSLRTSFGSEDRGFSVRCIRT